METYIALLRGINVSGQRIIKMEWLRRQFEAMGFEQVRTYIQSGNIIFLTKKTTEKTLRKKIESTLEQALGYPVDVILRRPKEIEALIGSHPYGEMGAEESRKLYIAFLHEPPAAELQPPFLAMQSPGESFVIAGREVYISIAKDHPKPLFTNMLLEKKLKTVATTRNWATVNKLLQLSAEG